MCRAVSRCQLLAGCMLELPNAAGDRLAQHGEPGSLDADPPSRLDCAEQFSCGRSSAQHGTAAVAVLGTTVLLTYWCSSLVAWQQRSAWHARRNHVGVPAMVPRLYRSFSPTAWHALAGQVQSGLRHGQSGPRLRQDSWLWGGPASPPTLFRLLPTATEEQEASLTQGQTSILYHM